MSSKEWVTHKLGYLLGEKGYVRGPFGSSLKRGEMKLSGIPVYEQQHAIYNSREFRFFIDEDKLKELKRFQVKTNDLIVSCSGTIGKVSIIREEDPKGIISQALLILRPDNTKILPEYLQYYFSTREGFNNLISTSHGSVQINIAGRDIVESIQLKIPNIPTQRRIVEILSAVDEKIELNRQTNETLEAIAQSIFKEWFVDFNFPGATGKLIESELGEIPEGWKICSLESISKRITDGAHGSPKSTDVGYPMASVKDMRTWGIDIESCRKISKEDYLQLVRSDCKPLKNDILIAKDGSYLKHIFVTQEEVDLVVLSSIAILRPNEEAVNPFVLSYMLKQRSVLERMKNYVSGAVIQRIVIKDFKKFKVVLPPIELQQQWDAACGTILKKCWENIRENEMLSQVRDTLLPKLMSGEINLTEEK